MVLDFDRLQRQLPELTPHYRAASPFPYIVLDDFLDPQLAETVHDQFPSPQSEAWMSYIHVNEHKQAQTNRAHIPAPALDVIDTLNSDRFVRWLSELSGISGLVADPSMQGGGLHQTKRGGHLNVHADFTSHPFHKNWARRLNILVYLNPGWQESWGGHLQLWDRQAKHCEKKVLPVMNRCLIFSTAPDSFHGLPDPLACPEGMTRKSIALYYFTVEKKPVLIQSTEYRARPEDSLKRKALIFADKMLLRATDALRRVIPISDRTLGRVLRLFDRT